MSDAVFWAPWHPQRGFEPPEFYGPISVSEDLDDVVRQVKSFNAAEGTNNRNGWRATKIKIERVTE